MAIITMINLCKTWVRIISKSVFLHLPIAEPSPVVNVNTKGIESVPDSGLRRTPRFANPTDSEKVYEGCSNPKNKSTMEWNVHII